jgi:hypothetical protein
LRAAGKQAGKQEIGIKEMGAWHQEKIFLRDEEEDFLLVSHAGVLARDLAEAPVRYCIL